MRHAITLVAVLAMFMPALARAQTQPTPLFKDPLVLEPTARPARAPINRDAVQLLIASGAWRRPVEGATVTLSDGSTKAWSKANMNADGSVKCPTAGSVFTLVHTDSDRIAILHTLGCSTVYVNGEPRAGDPYGAGYWSLPISLKKGDNDFLFLGARGDIAATLSDPPATAYLDLADCTLPDIVVDDTTVLFASITLVNATNSAATDLVVSSAVTGGPLLTMTSSTHPFRIEPLTIRKVPVIFSVPTQHQPGTLKLDLKLSRGAQSLHETHVDLRVCPATENHKRTFISETDGSVQYYAVNPARPLPGDTHPPALVLSLHGADVEATGQAGSYAGKSWAHIICPTNRRPFGFDWEDWGRLDALEALADAKKRYPHDESRVYLTGHSMGGHGTWSLSCLMPDLFAAAAPSAGWISFASYAGAPRPENPNPVESLLFRAAEPSQTLTMLRNIAPIGVFILHGDADDNVPVTQARNMREQLAPFHHDFAWHEQAGAGHWWENSDEPGAECLDWPGIFDLFARRRLPANAEVRDVDFTTANPRVSSTMRWLTIEAQQKPLIASNAALRCDPGKRRFVGTTANVRRLALDVSHLAPDFPVAVDIDGTKLDAIPWPADGRLHLGRDGDAWAVVGAPSPTLKGPHRAGPFKDVFRNRAAIVYGTGGTPQENALAYAKARYDAETFAYRGNGSLDLMPDTAFDPAKEPDRNVVLYGNAETNRLWKQLLGDSPVNVTRTQVNVGTKTLSGDDLACLFIRPRTGSSTAMVGAVAATGPAGIRTTDRLPFFLSGVAFPDVTVLSPAIFKDGSAAVVGAGFFGDDWSVDSGEFAWKE